MLGILMSKKQNESCLHGVCFLVEEAGNGSTYMYVSMDWTVSSPSLPLAQVLVEALTPRAMIFGGRAFGR